MIKGASPDQQAEIKRDVVIDAGPKPGPADPLRRLVCHWLNMAELYRASDAKESSEYYAGLASAYGAAAIDLECMLNGGDPEKEALERFKVAWESIQSPNRAT